MVSEAFGAQGIHYMSPLSWKIEKREYRTNIL